MRAVFTLKPIIQFPVVLYVCNSENEKVHLAHLSRYLD